MAEKLSLELKDLYTVRLLGKESLNDKTDFSGYHLQNVIFTFLRIRLLKTLNGKHRVL